ncbi:fructose-6-phosphate aldolase [Alicyclobacillus acidoterrestris]|uniref:Probable transaldolase n=1 Tax=Alicyclobacillus acidoterrestris (strain ATCC 49025 / DSM 3922 / CIP 106132 / NCIMB 13137 / GD3B) TaxID=1356854 RepID=T0BNB8_ALIAG|nr:fructose-6-phosphate aldolase [Alicyclobacillus acidoterrestris]EPZ45508.1 transaldolase [Alicyclobacillus acidoterrestris ATCC 49025]UNO49489.1 fructose-6-phosphate aldolase [Alicyclobacillus acidoterrestris]
MKLFLDTIHVEDIRQAAQMGILRGVTTNPSLVAKAGRDYIEVLQQIVPLVDGPTSAEVVSLDADGMVREALSLADLDHNIVIQVPMTTEGLKAVYQLANLGIHTNVTLVFSVNQALLAAQAGARYVSPFLGRLDDISLDGVALIADIVQVFRTHDIDTEVIASSIRHPSHVTQAAKAGAHIAAVPFDVLDQMIKHPLTDRGIERFLADWSTLQKR